MQPRRARRHAAYLPRYYVLETGGKKKISVGRVIYYLAVRRGRESFLNSSTARVVRRSALETPRIMMITVAMVRRAYDDTGSRTEKKPARIQSFMRETRRGSRYFRNGAGGRGPKRFNINNATVSCVVRRAAALVHTALVVAGQRPTGNNGRGGKNGRGIIAAQPVGQQPTAEPCEKVAKTLRRGRRAIGSILRKHWV